MDCPTCQGTMRGKTVNTGKGPRQVFECNQDNGECLNDKGYPTSVWPKGNSRSAPPKGYPPPRGNAAPPPPQQRNGDDRSSRIERQHSQEMALRYAALKDMGDISTKDLRELIDWFQRDVGHVPAPPQRRQEPEPEPPPSQRAGASGEPSQDLGYDEDEAPF